MVLKSTLQYDRADARVILPITEIRLSFATHA